MDTSVKETMSVSPVAINFNESLAKAYSQMKAAGFRHLPVVDQNNTLVGIISDRDLLKAMWPIPPSDGYSLPTDPVFKKDAKVLDYMSWPVKTLKHTDELIRAVNIMIDEKISAVVVMRNNQMIGILTHEDLLRVLASLLNEPKAMKQKIVDFVYNSTNSSVTDFLAKTGI